MNSTFRYILIIAGIAAGIFIIWYFLNIVAYILISAVLSLIGRPLVDFLGKIHVAKKNIPKALRALITLLSIWVFCVAFFVFIIPLVSSELNNLANIDSQNVVTKLSEPIAQLEEKVDKYVLDREEKFTVQEFVTTKINSVFNVSFMSNLFGGIASALGNIFIAVFSISFITFFFLRDERLFAEAVLAMVPDKHVRSFTHAMESTRRLLIRYFVGILLQISGVFILVTLGLTIVGVGFTHSLLIGLIAATLNVIPYLGPFLGGFIGIILGIITNLQLDLYSELLPLAGLIVLIFIIVQLTDNFIFQPLIFSSSVNAHPLEIFLVIMIAGSLVGIPGMILAIPAYTVLRVFAKEFFNKFKVVKKLTHKIE